MVIAPAPRGGGKRCALTLDDPASSSVHGLIAKRPTKQEPPELHSSAIYHIAVKQVDGPPTRLKLELRPRCRLVYLMSTRGGHIDFDKLVRGILLDIDLLQWICNAPRQA